ncbi:MAG: RuBisCO large subunit C-terminal-like domain-containing protein [Actinobacteria bacterium]|nr:RuBisCO large subunit C-terminal-like domain-containing protein [Actinomycetota bacterium]
MDRLYESKIFDYSLESVVKKDYIIATYYLEDYLENVDFIDHFQKIQEIVLECSTGSWVRVKEETPEVREKLSGKLISYFEIPAPKHTKKAVFQLALPTAAWDLNTNIPMMMLSMAGNVFFFSKSLRILDVSFPESLTKQLNGPKFGIEGLRKYTGVYGRPFSLHIIKPKMGMTPEQTADQVYQTALGGADFAKDDEISSDVFNCTMEDRLVAVLKTVEKAKKKTGKELIYFVSVTTDVDRIVDRARRAVELGAKGLLVSYPAGFSAIKALASDPMIDVPILMHPSNMGSLFPTHSPIFLAKIARLSGVDILLGPSNWGELQPVSLEESLKWTQAVRAPLYDVKPTIPMIGGGVHPGIAEIYIREIGIDMVMAAGGGMLGHPDGYTAGARAWRQAIDAVMNDIPLPEAAKTNPELKAALDYYGYYKRPKTPWFYASPEYIPKLFTE